jgi:N-acetylmuramoyl-L-alanine amidase
MSLQIQQHPSPNFDKRGADVSVDMLVLHYTGMQSADIALDRLCDQQAEVSAHYFVEEDGSVRQLVDETHRAWHAGVSYWRGNSNINQRSIGIEIVNPGHEFGYREFTEEQMISVISLCSEILSRHDIPARNIVGHSDVAPSRKTDPGELFDWQRLAKLGIGLWPTEAEILEMDKDVVRGHLQTIGYDTNDFPKAIRAFQRHYRGERVTGRIDAGTARLLTGLAMMMAET